MASSQSCRPQNFSARQSHVSWHKYRTNWFTQSAHMEKLDNRVLHLEMNLSTKSSISF